MSSRRRGAAPRKADPRAAARGRHQGPHEGHPGALEALVDGPDRSWAPCNHLDAAVPAIHDDDVARGAHGHIPGTVKLSVASAFAAEHAAKVALAVKDLDALVVVV